LPRERERTTVRYKETAENWNSRQLKSCTEILNWNVGLQEWNFMEAL